MSSDPRIAALRALPNVGPKVAERLVALGVERPEDLLHADPDDLFERSCALAGRREDPCLLDTYTVIVEHARGAPSRPWWEASRERLERA